jgi:hypothetical protein
MAEKDQTYDGGCACGSVRYRMETPPLFIHCCHCTWCQRQTGASYALNALIEADRVSLLQGKPEKTPTPSPSGKGQDIWRCPECRVALWSNYAGMGNKVGFVRVGTLDEAHRLEPDIHIYTESKQPWVVIAEGQVAVPTYYDKREHWPPASRERFRQLRNENN